MTVQKRGSILIISDLTKTDLVKALDVVTDHRIGSEAQLSYFTPEDGMMLRLTFENGMWATAFERELEKNDALAVE